MAVIKITSFGGQRPSTLARNLPADAAQLAQNLQAHTAEFRPLADDVIVAGGLLANPGSVYRASRNPDGTINTDPTTGWRSTAKAINFVRSQVNDNLTDRTYQTTADGSERPRVRDVLGNDRLLGVPAPLTKPNCTLAESYTFTAETRHAEVLAALSGAVTALLNGPTTEAWVGIRIVGSTRGWVNVYDYGPTEPNALRYVWRVFAVDPDDGDKLVDTYSDMPVEQAGWVFDPTLGGMYLTLGPGQPVPPWVGPYRKFWAVRFRAYSRALDLDLPAAVTALSNLSMPGTQDAEKWLSTEEATAIATRVVEAFDKDDPKVKQLVDRLVSLQAAVASHFNQGGAATLTTSIKQFYQRADVQAAIGAAKDVYAEHIWGLMVTVATASATPPYVNPDLLGAGAA